MATEDRRLDVFLSGAKEVFQSVEHRSQIWREDPFDVDSVHAPARAQFQKMLSRANTPPGTDAGRILLLLGESGSGKTHLIRSFRNHVHSNGLGFVGYMQMTTGASSYSRYILSNLIDSLDQPYYESIGTTGLVRLSKAIAGSCQDKDAIDALHTIDALSTDEVIDLVNRAADRFVGQPRYADVDLDLVRALLYLQRNDPGLKSRVVKYLRCEELNDRDRKLLDISSRQGEEDAQRLVVQLGKLIWSFNSLSLVLCVDQLEDMGDFEGAEGPFRRAMAALSAIADHVPSSIVVICCLDDFYATLRKRLTRSTLDRLENDPPRVNLVGKRTAEEVEKIIAQRLGYLYETSNVLPPSEDDGDRCYPIPLALVESVRGLRTRDVLEECRKYREACVDSGKILTLADLVKNAGKNGEDETMNGSGNGHEPAPRPDVGAANLAKTKLEQDWNDYFSQHRKEPSEDEDELIELFGWAIRTCAEELESGHRFEVVPEKDIFLRVAVMVPEADGSHRARESIVVALCNKGPQGGGLGSQIEKAEKHAKTAILALIRCGEFPGNPSSAVGKKVAALKKEDGKRLVSVEDSDWRKLAAFRAYRAANEQRPYFKEWLMEENHLSRLMSLILVLGLDRLERFGPMVKPITSAPPAPASASPPQELPPPAIAQPRLTAEAPATEALPTKYEPLPANKSLLALGTTGDLVPQTLTFEPETLSAHAAFLGSTGSGKTTLALSITEQILLRGIPVILVDRKGDLCAYGREEPWEKTLPDPALDERRRALRERLDIALFTPGHPDGRPLAISLVPPGLSGLKDFDRDQAVGYAANALADMLGYKPSSRKDKSLRAILVQAFQLFAAHIGPDRLDLESLISFIAKEDPLLVAALGRLDIRLSSVLVQDLETLKLSASDLLSPTGEKLDVDLLLGLGAHAQPGKTRLSVISTKFLGDNARILFWVSQLLLSLTRWVARTPSPRLQAVIMFDEADVYLPAQSQPATKAPMENLLRRARSGGLGLFLATQSPGDLDYKCRDNIRSWFVGRVTQTVALDKMKPLLSDARVNIATKIPAQRVGEFHLLQDGKPTSFRAQQAVLRTDQVPENEILALAARRKVTR
jgi:energy-coupling factor transporter ATP-binding protein EcfA2